MIILHTKTYQHIVNNKHIYINNHKHTMSLKCQRNLSLVFFNEQFCPLRPFELLGSLGCVFSAQVLESSYVLEVHLHSASASCPDKALDLASCQMVVDLVVDGRVGQVG